MDTHYKHRFTDNFAFAMVDAGCYERLGFKVNFEDWVLTYIAGGEL